jgi:Ca2+-binding RTX toxin-like protein
MATIVGTNGNDNLTSTADDDSIQGLGGNDWINFPSGGYGDDTVDGGTGYDTLDFRPSGAAGIVADYRNGTIVSAAGTVSFANVERVVGTNVDDQLIGAAGNENLTAAGGDDTLEGGTGNDWLWGGGGADAFVFRETGTANADNIGDFGGAADRIVLDATVMTALGAEGQFSAGDARFVANSSGTAQDSSDRVVYNTTTRQLFYDADGDGSGAAQLIATLQSGATLSATNIVVEGGGTPPPGGATEGDDVIIGTEGNDTIDALGGNDTIDGLGGADTLIGGAGNDRIISSGLDDDVDGGTGADTQIVNVADDDDPFGWAVTAGAGIEVLVVRDYESGTAYDRPKTASGNELNNVVRDDGLGGLGMEGGAGDDTLVGGAGDNVFYAPVGNDIFDGGDGTDALVLGGPAAVDFRAGTVTVSGGQASFTDVEQAYGSGLDDVMTGGDGAVRLYGAGGDDVLTGGAGNDFISGDETFDPTSFGIGDDVLSGQGGNDSIWGLSGNDRLSGGEGNDFLDGGPNFVDPSSPDRDHLVFDVAPGAANADTVSGFVSAADTIEVDGEAFASIGSSGRFVAGDARFAANASGTAQDASDRIVYNTASGQLWYDADGDGGGEALLVATLDGAPGLAATDIEVVNGSVGGGGGEHIVGTSGNDTLTGTEGDDTIEGLGGNDWINMGPDYGDDVVDGGTGSDTIDFRPSGAPGIVADYGTGTIVSSMGTTSFSNVERVVATHADDHLIGASGAQNLSGVGGNDILEGRTGNDWLWGGGGNDTFVFREHGSTNADNIGDFAAGLDTIALDNAVMIALGADGDFATGDGRFTANGSGTAQDGGDRVVYNTSTGQLYYDADGSGGGASQLIATLSGAPGLTATDIAVI